MAPTCTNACFQFQGPQDIDMGKGVFETLPDCLLTQIISVLPLNQAARTSSFSRRWRYLWKHIDPLNLQVVGDSCLYSTNLSHLHIAKLKTLCIKFEKPHDNNPAEIKKLIDFGIQKGVQDLCLIGGSKIPDNIYFITTLTKLEVDLCDNGLPSSINLPRVHTIVLRRMILDKTNLHCLISNAPVLESLFIDEWLDNDRLEIKGSPTLKRLKFRCGRRRVPSEGVDIVDLPSLEALELQGPQFLGMSSTFSNLPSLQTVSLCLYFDDEDKDDLEYGLLSVMNRLPQVKALRLRIFMTFLVDHEEAKGRLQCMNITRLELNTSIVFPVHVQFMCHLLSSSPHLEILKILDYESYHCTREVECWNHIEYSFSSLLPRLREVIIHLSPVDSRELKYYPGSNSWDGKLKLIRILLSKSRTLEKLTVVLLRSYGSNPDPDRLISKIHHILRGYEKASSSIEILLSKE